MRFVPKTTLVLVALCLFQLPLYAGFPQTVTDDAGNRIELKSKPVRILSLTLLTDEVLFSMVDPKRFVAVSTMAVNQDYSNVAALAAKVPTKAQFTVETAIALNPDLVLVANWSDPGKVEQVRKAGIPVYLLASPLDFAGLKQKITVLGGLVGEEATAKAMVADIDQRLAAVEKRIASIPVSKRKSALDYNTWGSSSGLGSSWNEILTKAGIANGAAPYKADGYGSVPMSKEMVLVIDPDLLFVPSVVYDDPAGASNFLKGILADPALKGTKAVKSKQVLQMPEKLKSTVSQYMVDAVEYLAKVAYPAN